jgi:hypothetical protein
VKTRTARLAGLLLSYTVIAGCQATTSTGAEQPLASATYAGAIAERIEYLGGTITLDVPSPSARASVSWSSAYVTNCESGDAICVPDQKATVFLAVATISNAGAEQADGSLRPLISGALVFVIEYTGEQCARSGPADPEHTAKVTPTPELCTVLNFVDARSGKVVYTLEGPDVKPLR